MSNRKVDLKVILLGPANAGKTCFLTRYVKNEFGRTEATVGASFAMKYWNGLKFGIWDTAGQEKYDSLSSFYCRNAGAVILVYDITDQGSFQELPRFAEKINECDRGCLVVLVGTKLDKVEEGVSQRQVATKAGEDFAQTIKAVGFFETSSKTGKNVHEVFDLIGKTAQERIGTQGGSSIAPVSGAGGASSGAAQGDTVNVGADAPSGGKSQGGCCK